MIRYVILTLITLVFAGCGYQPTATVDQAGTQAVLGEATVATHTIKAPTTSPESTTTSTPAPTLTSTKTATPSSTPIPSSTPKPQSTSTATIVTRTRSQDGMIMVEVPAGDFIMGSLAGEGSDDEVPQHTVTLDGYWIDRMEVTNSQYRLFVEATGHQAPTKCDWGDPTYDDGAKANHPVVCVSAKDALAYCEWAGARLPTEAEWEKAARGTDRRTYPWGFTFDGSWVNFCDINCEGSHRDTEYNDGYARTAPVGSYPLGASPYGALDMAGNALEWVSDRYIYSFYGKSPQYNPQSLGASGYQVLRGGSWYGYITNMRVAARVWLTPVNRNAITGFRCVIPITLSP